MDRPAMRCFSLGTLANGDTKSVMDDTSVCDGRHVAGNAYA